MKATNKHEFFELLGYELGRLGIEDTAEIFADFKEHFEDGAMRGIPEEETAERLGDIKEIARSYLNLESSRINSIIARDNERHRVSLTKPGRDVPADLSLLNKNIVNSDNIREYTPEHFSSEIYPNAGQTAGQSSSQASANTAKPSGEKTVADAFSEAGRAALDAAKVTGHAIKDAFGQSGVKDAVVGAGKSAANAVKTAGQNARDAVKKARDSRNTQNTVPHPTDSYRANNTSETRQGSIPPQYGKAKAKSGYKVINVSELKTNVNGVKLVIAILLDLFLWSWLLPTAFATAISVMTGGALGLVAVAIETLVGDYGIFWQYYFPSRFFLAVAFLATAFIVANIGIWLIKLCLKLVVFVINTHIKAIYDL